jgi:hypothetical protein
VVTAVAAKRKIKRTTRHLPDNSVEVIEDIEEDVKEETQKKEEIRYVTKTETEVVERVVEKARSSYSVGMDYTPPISSSGIQPLKEGVLGVSVGKRVFGRVWVEGRVASPLNTLKPSASVGIRLEF